MSELREESIRVLEWAASVFRRGTPAHDELAGLAGRLRDPDVAFRAVSGDASDAVRRRLLELRDAAQALSRALPDLPYAIPPVDLAFADLAGRTAAAGLEAMGRDVTFAQVTRRLSGSWGDTDLGDAISSLERRMAAALEAVPDEADASPSPGPGI